MITPAINIPNARIKTIGSRILNTALSKNRNRERISIVPTANRIFVTVFAVVYSNANHLAID